MPTPTSPSRPGEHRLTEIADRVWSLRFAAYDVQTTLVAGEEAWLVVDTGVGEADGGVIRDALHRLAPGVALRHVVLTHDHHDHVLGTAPLRDDWPAARVLGHESTAATMAATAAASDEGKAARLVECDDTLSGADALDLGDRLVEVLHPGRGHTAGDVVLRVPDADVLIAGDLIEAADDPALAVPAYGSDSWPLEWPGAVELLVGLCGPATRVVPGHGPIVGRDLVLDQHAGLGALAARVHELAGSGVGLEAAQRDDGWPWPLERLGSALPRAWAQLSPAQRRLPMA